MPFKVDAIRYKQKEVTMFLAALPVEDLDICSIDAWDPKKTGVWKGYQRQLKQKKIKNISEYLQRPDGIMPVAGLLNVREKGVLKFDKKDGSKPAAGLLTIPDYTRLWVVDMQHRLEGIRLAHSKGFLQNFAIPVLITDGLTNIKEAAQFYIINTRSHRMGVDLTRRLLIEHDEIKDIVDVKEWELKAVQITIKLNKNIKKNNPWYGRIREPESERLLSHIATEKSFVPSLRWFLTARGVKGKSVSNLAKFMAAFWEGLRLNMPDAFESPREFLIQKTPGFMAFHRLAPLVYRKLKGKAVVSQHKKVFEVFSRDIKFNSKFWNRHNLNGAKRYGTGQGAYATLAMDISKKLGL